MTTSGGGVKLAAAGPARAAVSGYGTYILSYSGSSILTGPQTVSAPRGNFLALQLDYQYSITGTASGLGINLPFVATDWYTQSIGLVQETAGANTVVLSQPTLRSKMQTTALSIWLLAGTLSATAPKRPST